MKIKITEITEWEKDERLMEGDASHEGWEAVNELVGEEEDEKQNGEWTKGLPFVCEAEDEEEALQKYNDEICEYDYLKAVGCEWEEVES